MTQLTNGKVLENVSTGSERLLARARHSIAGGDNSTMRVLPYHLPLVATRGEGSRVWDIDGQSYIDLNMAYGPLIFGHRPPAIIDAVVRQITQSGTQLGFPAEVSVRVAEKVKGLFPQIELLRFSSTGTEALVAALFIQMAVIFLKKSEQEHLDACAQYCLRNIVNRLRVLPFEGGEE